MDLPGAGGAMDPEAWANAEAESERLLEELKKEVKAETKDIGVLRKELRITVPAKVITDHMEHNYDELMSDAQVPGFRKGRAPRQLIEKRFGAEVRESLTSSIVGQSYYAVVENEELDALGDPLFRIEEEAGVKLMDIGEALQHFKLPDGEDFSYTCEVELKPKFDLPELKGIEVKSPEIDITDEMIESQMLQRRKIRGRLEPVEEPAAKDDQIVADAVLSVDDSEVKREENIEIGVRPTRLDGIALMKLDETLSGAKAGDTKRVECTIPDDYERADLRGKTGTFEFKIHDVKRLVPEALPEFLKAWGFEGESEARDHFRDELEAERDQLMERARKAQIEDYLLEQTAVELPTDFSARQTDHAVVRKVIDLQQRGVPMNDIEARIDELRTSAKEEVGRELKLSFIFDKVAEALGVDVTDEEVNTEIARIARMYNRRFDRIRDDLQSRGLLTQLVQQIRDDKCIAHLLADAKVSAASAAPDKAADKK
jgi:trigger factor